MNEQQITQLFRDGWSTLEVGPAPVEAVVASAGRQRRRIVTSVTLGLAAVLALAVVLAVSIGGEPDLEPVDTGVRSESNPVDVAWVEGDELHLESVVVAVPATDGLSEVTSLAQVTDGDSYGVVYSLVDGPVVHVDRQGLATAIDDPRTPVTVVSSGTSWVAWVDPSGDAPELVVWNSEDGRYVDRIGLPDVRPAQVVAVDGETVYVHTGEQDLFWEQGMDALEPVELSDGRRLLDAAAGALLTVNRELDRVGLDRGDRAGLTVSGGQGAQLSPDAQVLVPGSPLGVGVRGGPEVLSSDTGEPIDFDVPPDDVVLATSLGAETATFVMGRDFVVPEDIEQDRGGYRQVLLVTCTYSDGSCQVAVDDLDAEQSSRSPVLFGL